MHRSLIGWALLLALPGFATVCAAAPDKDYLVLVDIAQASAYRATLLSKIGITPFDYGRIIVRPSFEPEFAISVYSQRDTHGRPAHHITYISLAENLYQKTDGGHHVEKARRLRTRRIDADLSETTANVLREVWFQMLRRASGHVPPPRSEWEVIPGDTTDIEWSLEQANGTALYGQLNQYVAKIGKRTQTFIHLTDDLLVEYCEAKPSSRASLDAKLHAEARRLLALLRR